MSEPILWSPTRLLEVRGPDDYASAGGGWHANRTHGRSNGGAIAEKNEPHLGIDLVCPPLTTLVWPCDGLFWRMGLAYAGDPRFHSVHIRPAGFPDYDVKILYLTPRFFHTPQEVGALDEMGIAEDLRMRYPDPDGPGPKTFIINHVHFAVYYKGEAIDPGPLLRAAA